MGALIGIGLGLVAIFNGFGVLFDSGCNRVGFGGQGRYVAITCYEAGMSGGMMPGWMAGILLIIAGIVMGFVGLASSGR